MDYAASGPAVVLGAGPYGLAVAAHLRARGVPVRIFGEPMESWRHRMPPGMFLKSVPAASSISAPVPGHTLADFCALRGVGPLGRDEPVPIDLFVAYGQWFARDLVPDVEQTRVRLLRRRGAALDVVLETGELVRTRTVVVATGLSGFAHVPPSLSRLEHTGLVSHSSRYGDLSTLAGSDVVVVGAGQSALETAVLLHEAGARVQVVARRRVRFAGAPPAQGARRPLPFLQPDSPLGPGWRHVAVSSMPGSFRRLPVALRLELVRRILGPSGAWWLRERFAGAITVHEGRQVVGAAAHGDRVHLWLRDPGGRQTMLGADHLVAATGYRVDVDRLDIIDPATRAALRRTGGSPALGASFESSVPGLYFPGLSAAATFGPVQRFVCGTGFAAARISAAVAARTRQPVLR